MLDYLYIFLYFIVSIVLSCILLILSLVVSPRITDIEKVSAYECGFHPFQDARGKYDVRFYLVAILFIIFDLEIMFLFPWSVIYKFITFGGFLIMILFILILTLGFVYEWKKGALDWE